MFKFSIQIAPFAYVLMSNKTEVAYTSVFEYINAQVMPLECASYMTDYERAMRNGLAKVIPEAKQTACWFHFCQACKRNAAHIPNLMKTIEKDEIGKQAYYELLALPLLPAEEIRPAFEIIKARVIEKETPDFIPFLA